MGSSWRKMTAWPWWLPKRPRARSWVNCWAHGWALIGKLYRHVLSAAVFGVLTQPSLWLNRRIWNRIGERFFGFFSRRGKTEEVKQDRQTGCLFVIGVSPRVQGGGVGNELISRFEIFCRGLGLQRAVLSVYAENESARRFYERRAWRELEGDFGRDAVYEKDLG